MYASELLQLENDFKMKYVEEMYSEKYRPTPQQLEEMKEILNRRLDEVLN